VPDGLAFFDFVFAALIGGSSFYLLASEDSLVSATFWGLLFFLLIWIVIPIALNVVAFRPRVYQGAKARITPRLVKWFTGLPSRIIIQPCSGRNDFTNVAEMQWRVNGRIAIEMVRMRIYNLLRFRTLEQDPVYTQPGSSPQGAFLALALAEYFEASGSNIVLSRGFMRFIIVYCYPLWVSYVSLLGMLVIMNDTNMTVLVAVTFGWAVIAFWFLLRAVVGYGEWLDMLLSDPWALLRALPHPSIWKSLNERPRELAIVRDFLVRNVASLITMAGVIIALTALQVFG
jgi:hypothetical protein